MVVQGSEEDRRNRIRSLAAEAQAVWAKVSPDLVSSLVRDLDNKIDELEKLRGVVDQLSMAARDLLSLAKNGITPEKEEQLSELCHNLESALFNSDALKRFRRKPI